MVYCGKPSKGCSNCRERKIRCDQRQPGCGQCEKRKKQCPGYRNLMDLMFRDESSHVINKANAKGRKKGVSSPDKITPSPVNAAPGPWALQRSPTSSRSSSSPEQLSRTTTNTSMTTADSRPSPTIKVDDNDEGVLKKEHGRRLLADALGPLSYSLSPGFQERGINLFVTRYITMNENMCHHKYDFIFDLWTPSTSDPDNDLVLAGVTAVGLVGVAEMTRSNEIQDAARRSYGRALRLTNAALRDPDEAVKDTTMLSVMVLGLFELVGGSRARGIESWQKHLHGAAALARMRGMSQFRKPAGVRLFFMLTQNTMVSCIQNELPMPADLLELRRQVGLMLGIRDPGYELCTTMYKVLQLRYDIKQGNVTNLEEMLEQFTEAENDFASTMSVFPEAWRYRKYHLPQHPRPGFFGNLYHVYPTMQVGSIWNGLRTCRLLILETMLEELRQRFLHVPVRLVPRRYQHEYQRAVFKMEKIALAILASIPQHFGLISALGDAQEPLTPMSGSDDLWSNIPVNDLVAELGSEGDIPDPSRRDDEDDDDYYCRSPSLNNPMQTKDADVRAERFMMLSSATNSLVWPLYLVGMSTASSAPMKAFVVERLHAIHAETGAAQPKDLADVITTHMHSTEKPRQRRKSRESMKRSSHYVDETQRVKLSPV